MVENPKKNNICHNVIIKPTRSTHECTNESYYSKRPTLTHVKFPKTIFIGEKKNSWLIK